MPVVHAVDRSGNKLQMQYMDHFFFPFFPFDSENPRQHVLDIQNLELRDDDIFLWSYAKCGNHWLWEMIQMLQRGNVEYDKKTKEACTIDFMTPAMLEDLSSPRTLNCHFLHRHIPQQIFQKKTKTLVLHRDPKDVAVSWYHHMIGTEGLFPYDGTFTDFMELFLEGTLPYGSWFDYELSVMETLEKHPDLPVLHIFYEDMKQDGAKELGRVAKFVGLAERPDLCKQIAEACEFKKLKQVISERPDPLRLSWKEGFEGMCRKGIVGDWKNWFSPQDLTDLNRVFEEKLSGTFLADRYFKDAFINSQQSV